MNGKRSLKLGLKNHYWKTHYLSGFHALFLIFAILLASSCNTEDSNSENLETDLLEANNNPVAQRDLNKKIKPTRLFFSPRNEVMAVGSRLTFDVRGEFASDLEKDISEEVIWEAENQEIAEFVEQGVLKAKKEGKTKIFLKLDDLLETTEITVIPAKNQNMIMIPSNKTLELFLKEGKPVAQQLQYQSVIIRSDGSLDDVSKSSAWRLAFLTKEQYDALEKTEEAAEDYTYIATQKVEWQTLESASFSIDAPGVYFVETKFTDPDGKELAVYGKIEAALESLRPIGIQVINSPITIPLGSTEEVKIEIAYNDGTKRQVTEGFQLTIEGEGAELSGTRDVKVLATGQTTLNVTLDNLKAEGIIYGLNAVLESIYVDPTGAIVKKGLNSEFNVFAKFNDGNVRNITRFADYTNLNPDFISLSNDAITNQPQITTIEFGRGEVQVDYQGKSAKYTVDVSNAKIDSIEFEPALIDLVVGVGDIYIKYFKVFANKSDGTRVDVTNIATIEVKGQTLTKMFEEEPGKIRGVIAGSTQLEAEVVDPTTSLKIKSRIDVEVTSADALALRWDNASSTCSNFNVPTEYQDLPCFQVNQGLTVELGRVIATLSDGTDSPADKDAQLYVELLDHEGTDFQSIGNLRMDNRSGSLFFDSKKEGHTLAVIEFKGLVKRAWVYVGPPRIDSVLIFRVDPFLGVSQGRQFAQVSTNSNGTVATINKNTQAEYRAYIQYSHYHTLPTEERQKDVTVVDLAEHPNLVVNWTATPNFSGSLVDLGDSQMEQPMVYRITGDVEGTDSLRVNANLTIHYSIGSEVDSIEATTPITVQTTCPNPGRRYGNYCFILTNAGESCTNACNDLNIPVTGTPWLGAHQATNFYIGSGAEDFRQCQDLMNNLYSNDYEIFTSRRPTPIDGLGCGIITTNGEQVAVYNAVEVNSDGTDVNIFEASFRIACACDHE